MADFEIVRFRDPNIVGIVREHEMTKNALMMEIPGGETVKSQGLPFNPLFVFGSKFKFVDPDFDTLPSRAMQVIYMPDLLRDSFWTGFAHSSEPELHYEEVLKRLPDFFQQGLVWKLGRASEIMRVWLNYVVNIEGLQKTTIPLVPPGSELWTLTADEVFSLRRRGNIENWPLRISVGLGRPSLSMKSRLEFYMNAAGPEYGGSSAYVGVFPLGIPVEIVEKEDYKT